MWSERTQRYWGPRKGSGGEGTAVRKGKVILRKITEFWLGMMVILWDNKHKRDSLGYRWMLGCVKNCHCNSIKRWHLYVVIRLGGCPRMTGFLVRSGAFTMGVGLLPWEFLLLSSLSLCLVHTCKCRIYAHWVTPSTMSWCSKKVLIRCSLTQLVLSSLWNQMNYC
jgi:hypothetical protein